MTESRSPARSRMLAVCCFLNEERHLPHFLESMLAQRLRPDRLLLVDDGSRDASAGIAAAFAAEHAFATFLPRPPRPLDRDRLAQAAELRAFHWALEQIDAADYDVVGKIDADLRLTPRTLEHLDHCMQMEPGVGVIGPYLSEIGRDGVQRRDDCPPNHVRGALKLYRGACFAQLRPIPEILGWDTIDEVTARMHGWQTRSEAIPDRDPLHLRPTGAQDGTIRAFRRWGACAWGYGSHPLYVLLGAFARLRMQPRVLGGANYLAGWAAAGIRGAPRADPHVRAFTRAENLQALGRRLRPAPRARVAAPDAGAQARARAKDDPEYLLHERYHGPTNRSLKLEVYYALKPFMPRSLQLALRRAYAPRQARAEFPSWPIEPVLVDRRDDEWLGRVRAAGGGPVEFVNYWPDGKRFASVLTHDVEGPAGVENVLRVIELEQRYGFVSSWNFVARWYPIPDGLFDQIRAKGCEIGLHGILHDGKLFSDRATFEANLPLIEDYVRRWDVVGFRSPATGRNAAWMAELPVLYDSSFPDTDPFEPQPGGCCSIMPFFFGDVVELPITLTQDHTMFEILRAPGIDLWRRKAEWIRERHGIVNLIVHPDYVLEQRLLDRYEAYLSFLAEQTDCWHALPRDVAHWWRQREALTVAPDGTIAGPTDFAATVAHAHEVGGRLTIDTQPFHCRGGPQHAAPRG